MEGIPLGSGKMANDAGACGAEESPLGRAAPDSGGGDGEAQGEFDVGMDISFQCD